MAAFNSIIMEKVLVEIPREKSSYNADFDWTNPLLFVGELLQFVQSQTFKLFGMEINVPGLTSNNDQKMRTFSVLMQITKAMFAKLELDAIAPEDSEAAKYVQALRDKGFVISHDSKAAATEAIKIWLQVKKLAVQNHQKATRAANVEKFVAIAQYRKLNKVHDTVINTALKQIGAGK